MASVARGGGEGCGPDGTVITPPHFGHFTRRPPAPSGTLIRVGQLGQAITWGMAGLAGSYRPPLLVSSASRFSASLIRCSSVSLAICSRYSSIAFVRSFSSLS